MFSILDYLKIGTGIACGIILYHLYAVAIGYPSAEREARKGYVVQSELDAAAARAAKAEREARIASDMAEAAQRQAETARTAEQLATDKLEKFIAQDTDDSGSRVTADDLRKLHDLRSTAQ